MLTLSGPTNLVVTQQTPNSQFLSWQNGAPARVTLIEQKVGSGSFVLVRAIINNPEGSVITNLLPGVTYSYRVRTQTNSTFSDYSNIAVSTTPPKTVFAASDRAGGLDAGALEAALADSDSGSGEDLGAATQ